MTDSAPAPLGADAMFTQVYERLKAMAGRRLSMGARGTLETTVLVHELYLRLSGNDALAFERPEQFFGYAARAMRHLLADRARDRLRQRAGGDWARVTLTGADSIQFDPRGFGAWAGGGGTSITLSRSGHSETITIDGLGRVTK